MSDMSTMSFYQQSLPGVDLPSRTLLLTYGVAGSDEGLDEVLAAQTIWNLHLLKTIEPGAGITMLINNEGGHVHHGFGIIDAMRYTGCPVTGIVLGCARSMAVWVLQACTHRVCYPNAELMIHNGTGDKTEWDRKRDKVCEDILFDRIRQKNPKYPRARLQKLLEKDTYLTAPEALALGLIDEVRE